MMAVKMAGSAIQPKTVSAILSRKVTNPTIAKRDESIGWARNEAIEATEAPIALIESVKSFAWDTFGASEKANIKTISSAEKALECRLMFLFVGSMK